MQTLIEQNCTFEFDENVVAEYAMETVHFYEATAGYGEDDFKAYIIQEFGSEDQFFDYCYNESLKMIETYLVIGAITSLEGCSIEGYSSTSTYSESEIYEFYVKLEGAFYNLFIQADENF